MDLAAERILVTGAAGFLGRHLVKGLQKRNVSTLITPTKNDYDLRDLSRIRALFDKERPSVVIHLAARVGGIGANRSNPATFFYDNLIMGAQLMEIAHVTKVAKFVSLGTVCSYPKFASIPFREDDIWNGYPEETNAPYGIAKKMLLVQGQAYRQQYGFNAIHLVPVNLYGPGDNFDPGTSHVIPAMIRKFLTAREEHAPKVVLWGSGTPTREFLYVEDAVEGILLATERFDGPDPVNLGSGVEISIRELAETIRGVVGYTGRIEWDLGQPDGQPRRKLDTSRAAENFGFKAHTTFALGLQRTVEWYENAISSMEQDGANQRSPADK